MTRGVADADALCGAYLGLSEVFGPDLPADPRFREAVTAALARLMAAGAARTVAEFGAQAP